MLSLHSLKYANEPCSLRSALPILHYQLFFGRQALASNLRIISTLIVCVLPCSIKDKPTAPALRVLDRTGQNARNAVIGQMAISQWRVNGMRRVGVGGHHGFRWVKTHPTGLGLWPYRHPWPRIKMLLLLHLSCGRRIRWIPPLRSQ